MTLLGWSLDTFCSVTPAHLLKQYLIHLRSRNPELFDEVDVTTGKKKVYAIDETPFM